jgi:hypothetical protein
MSKLIPSGLWRAAVLLPLAGCYVTQPYGYEQPAYPPPAYPPPGAYAPAPYPPPYGYSGDAPVVMEGGAAVPLVFLGGEWGYYDRDHRWNRAPAAARQAEPRAAAQPGAAAGPARPSGSSAAFRPPAQPAPQRQPEHERRRDCPQGQRC